MVEDRGAGIPAHGHVEDAAGELRSHAVKRGRENATGVSRLPGNVVAGQVRQPRC
jgi:hypothetical protein